MGFNGNRPERAQRGLKVQNNALTSIKRYLRRYKPYTVASEIKAVLKKHLNGADNGNRQISLKPEGLSRGHVLFSYATDAFLSEANQPISLGQSPPQRVYQFAGASYHDTSYSHPAYWESLQMARTFLDFGYCVDVINAVDAANLGRKKHYAFFVGHRYNFVRIAQRLNTDCVKVLHCDMAHPSISQRCHYVPVARTPAEKRHHFTGDQIRPADHGDRAR